MFLFLVWWSHVARVAARAVETLPEPECGQPSECTACTLDGRKTRTGGSQAISAAIEKSEPQKTPNNVL
jgi:hypothetical protein